MFDGTTMHVVRTNDAEPLFAHVKMMQEVAEDSTGGSGKYMGSLDPITAARFKKESGLRIGTKEFAHYVMKRLKDPNYRKFRA